MNSGVTARRHWYIYCLKTRITLLRLNGHCHCSVFMHDCQYRRSLHLMKISCSNLSVLSLFFFWAKYLSSCADDTFCKCRTSRNRQHCPGCTSNMWKVRGVTSTRPKDHCSYSSGVVLK